MSSKQPPNIELTKYLDDRFESFENSVAGIKSITESHARELQEINKALAEINLTLTKQHLELQSHIRRTDQVEHQLIPLTKHYHRLDGAWKFVVAIGVVVSILSQMGIIPLGK